MWARPTPSWPPLPAQTPASADQQTLVAAGASNLGTSAPAAGSVDFDRLLVITIVCVAGLMLLCIPLLAWCLRPDCIEIAKMRLGFTPKRPMVGEVRFRRESSGESPHFHSMPEKVHFDKYDIEVRQVRSR